MKRKNGYFKNSAPSEESHKETIHFNIETNAIKDMGNGTVMFSKPVTITDNSEMWSGAKYDIPTLDITQYAGKLTADHIDKLQNILGRVIGVKKVANRRVTIDGIDFAVKENPLADFAKKMLLAGYATDFSIETMGPWPDDDGIFFNAKLVGLSMVVTGNNKQAHINEIAEETLRNARANGLDVGMFAQALKLPLDKEKEVFNNDIDMLKKVKNTRGFAITLKFKNSDGEDTEATVAPGQTLEIPDTDANKGVEDQVGNAEEPKAEPAPTPTPEPTPAPAPDNGDKNTEAITKAVQAATAPLLEKVEKMEKTIFDNAVQEPKFTKMSKGSPVSVAVDGLDWRSRYNEQVKNAWEWLKGGSDTSRNKLVDINKYNLEALQEAGKVDNAVTIADFGNFVISPELLSEIEGFRSNFQPLLSKLNFRDTLSIRMAWLKRSGDISMSEVEFCDDNEDGNLKPISEYSAEIKTDDLHELAAVTPVCNAATRFLAADLLTDVAAGYRNDFDRKRAQIFVARLQQAVNETGNVAHYNTGSSGGADKNALNSFFAVGGMQEEIMGGTYVMSQASYWELAGRKFNAGQNVDDGFSIFTKGPDGQQLLLGSPIIVVPNELLPKLGSNQTRQFVVGGVTVTITMAVFYVDLSTFTGRTSGGLQYDLSTEAAYEENGTVKSAYQRNELVLRGSFFRGGAVRDPEKVVGLEAVNLS